MSTTCRSEPPLPPPAFSALAHTLPHHTPPTRSQGSGSIPHVAMWEHPPPPILERCAGHLPASLVVRLLVRLATR